VNGIGHAHVVENQRQVEHYDGHAARAALAEDIASAGNFILSRNILPEG
jgi:hypothetical protein